MADGFNMRSGTDLGTALRGHPQVPSLLVYYRGPGATFGDEMERILGFLRVGCHPLAPKTLWQSMQHLADRISNFPTFKSALPDTPYSWMLDGDDPAVAV